MNEGAHRLAIVGYWMQRLQEFAWENIAPEPWFFVLSSPAGELICRSDNLVLSDTMGDNEWQYPAFLVATDKIGNSVGRALVMESADLSYFSEGAA